MGVALPNTASVTITSGGVDGTRGDPRSFQVFGHHQRGKALADGDGFVHRTRRTIAQHEHAVGDAAEIRDQLADSGDSAIQTRGFVKQFPAGLFVPLRKASNTGFNASFVVRLGVPQGAEQEIGNAGHGRNHRQHRPLRLLFRADGCRHFDSLGGAHAGAAELHHKQIVH